MSQTLAETISQLGRSVDALAAIGAALDARANDVALDPAIHPHIEGVLSALGVSAAIESLPKTEIVPVLGQIRTFSLANAKLCLRRRAAPAGTTSSPNSCRRPAMPPPAFRIA